MRLNVLVLCLAVAASAGAAERPYPFEEMRLDNGLRVLTLEDFSTPIVAVQVWYHVGSKDELATRQGFAHLFEHLMFRGTDMLGPEGHFELIRGTGGHSNAFTSFDYTAYVNLLPANQLELALWLEAERMMFLNVDDEGFQTERKVVEEERRQNLNEPYGMVFEQMMPELFSRHPYRWTPIGKIPHLRAADLHEVKAFWDRFYVPANATLVIVGAVEHETAQKLTEQYFGWIPSLPAPVVERVEEPVYEGPQTVEIPERLGPLPMLRDVYRTVPEAHEDTPVLDVIANILGEGESSRLYRDLVKERKIAQSAFAYNMTLEEAGLFMLGAVLEPTGDLETVASVVDEHVQELLAEGPGEREVEKAVNTLKRSVVTGTLTVESKARLLAQAATVRDDPDWPNRQLAAVRDVTPEQVQAAAEKYLVPERLTEVRVVPTPTAAVSDEDEEVSEESLLSAVALQKEDIKRPEGFPTAPPLKELLEELPELPQSSRTLKNGLKVVVVENHEVPFVTVNLGLKYGAWAEDPEQAGAASMALTMLTQGTKDHTAQELAESIDFNALTLTGSAEMDVSNVQGAGLTEDLRLLVELLSEVVQEPTFPADQFAILQQQRLADLAVQEQEPSYIAERALREALYESHPYARSAEGETADVAALTPEIVAQWWRTYGRPDAAVLYIAGDIKPHAAFRLARKYLGEWKGEGEAPNPALPPVPDAQKTRILLVDRPGAVQSQIRLGQTSITRGHPYYHASRVFSQLYGGSFGSRLNKVIRVEKGLTYGANGGFVPQRYSGTFWTYTFTKTPTTAETVRALVDVIKSMQDAPPSEEEMAVAKSYLVGGFASALETPQDVVGYAWLIEYNGLHEDYLQQALEGYKATNQEDIAHLASEVINTDVLTIVVVGDAAQVRESLEAIAPVEVIAAPEQAAGLPEAP
jgi:zinc protease